MRFSNPFIRATLLAAALSTAIGAQAATDRWATPQEPFRLYGDTWYVGPHDVSAILITSPAGHILVDGGSPASAALIVQHIGQLGFKVEDIRYILNSHEHDDHAGGIAELQRLSGATVLASVKSEAVLRSGIQSPADPQYDPAFARTIPPIAHTRTVRDGETITLGPLAVTAHYTPGHTQGGVSWTWLAVENNVPVNIVYADSLTAFSSDSFRYSRNTVYPSALRDITKSIVTVAGLDCDILVSTHPEVSGLWERYANMKTQGSRAFIDRQACRTYAEGARVKLQAKLVEEAKADE
jgi:metallo-beta-lactamase class B